MDRALSLLSFSSPLKRFYKFLLKRILGSFLQYELDLAQLDVQLAKGEVELRDLDFNVQLLNELCADLPITFIRARIRLVKATIPWRNLLTKNCMLKLDGWELVIVPSEQVQHKSSASLSALVAQSVLSVDVSGHDAALQQSLASLGAHLRSRAAHLSSGRTTPMSMSATSSAAGSAMFPGKARNREEEEEEEERRHEAMTAASVRERERRRKRIEERRRRREELGEDFDSDEDEPEAEPASSSADSDHELDADALEAEASVRQHSARQAAALDTANEGLKVVASFLEQVVSAIELEVTNVTIRIQHQPKVGNKQTHVLIKLPWLHFSDLNAAKEREEASKEEQQSEEEYRTQRAQEREEARQRRAAERACRRAEAERSGDLEALSQLEAAEAQAEAEDEAEEEDEAAIRREMELKLARDSQPPPSRPLHSGPRYEYHKAIRFHGFRVELHEEINIDSSAQFQMHDTPQSFGGGATPQLFMERNLSEGSMSTPSEPQTIISGSMDQTCLIQLKLKMQDTLSDEPKLESSCFIQSLRALITPRQMALLMDLGNAIGLSAKQVAINAQIAQQQQQQQQAAAAVQANQAKQPGGFPPSSFPAASPHSSSFPPTAGQAHPLSHPDYHVIENLLSQQQQQQQHGGGASSSPSGEDQFFDLNDGGVADSSSPAAQLVNLWSMETHILHCSLTLPESDEQTWATDWWLSRESPSTGSSSSSSSPPSPDTLVPSLIPGLTSNHLFLSARHTFINIHQTSMESTVKVTLGDVKLEEYLVQARGEQQGGAGGAGEWWGFKARPLLSFSNSDPSSSAPPDLHYPSTAADDFIRSTRPLSAPHLSLEMRNSVEASHSLSFNEPPNLFFEPHEHAAITSRITLSCQPVSMDFDLGLGGRLKNLLDSLSAPLTYLHGELLPSASQVGSMSEASGYTFDMHRMGGGMGQMGGEEMLNQLANFNQQRRHSFGAEARAAASTAYSQIVLMAPSIDLNIHFPAHTPSQEQPHPYTPQRLFSHSPYTDARGLLRPEYLHVQLQEVSLSNECEAASSDSPDLRDSILSSLPQQDTEWLIRFHQADVFLRFPDLKAVQARGAETHVTPEDMLTKRVLTTTYPTAHSAHASAAFFSHAAAAAYISIVTRGAPVADAPQFRPAMSDPHAESTESESSPSTSAEEMFFDALPNVKFWEQETLNGERQRVFKSPLRHTSDGSQGNSNSPPDAAIFETMALQNSGLVVTIHLPVAAVHLAKADYDMVLFLYNIYSEFMSEEPAVIPAAVPAAQVEDAALESAHAFASQALPNSLSHSTLSLQEADDAVDVYGLARLSLSHRHPSASFHSALGEHDGGEDDELDDDEDEDHPLSRSDSFSSDSSSDMFESVVGADSVILKKGNPMERSHRSRSFQRFPHSSQTFSPSSARQRAAVASMSSSTLLKSSQILQPSTVLPPLEQLRLVDGGDTPLTMDSEQKEESPLLRDSHAVAEERDEDELSGDFSDEPQFDPTIGSSVSSSPRARHSSLGASEFVESNLSDADLSDASIPCDSEDEAGDSATGASTRKRITFGTESILFGQATQSGISDALSDSQVEDTPATPEVNPADIFARASRTSGQAQLFQPAGLNILPPLQEVSSSPPTQAHSLTHSDMLRSSMLESRDDGAMFQSFLAAPPGTFQGGASMLSQGGQMSVDYSHMSTQMASSRANMQAGRSMQATSRPLPPPVHAPPPAAPVPRVPSPAVSPFRHFMSLRLSIQRGSFVIQDDPPSGPTAASSSSSPSPFSPQTFHIDLGEVRLFQVLEFDGKPVSYISIRAGDLTLREYQQVILEDKQLFTQPSMPILFKTMGEEPVQGAETQQVDAWGQPLSASPGVSSSDPLPGVSLHDPLSSVAWKNPVLIINIVLKLNEAMALRDTQAVINLRALTLQFFPESVWIQKIMQFFTPAVYTPPAPPPAFNASVPPPPPPPPATKDLLHLFLHAYDCSVDYNPTSIDPRALLTLDHVHLQTDVYPDSPLSVLKIEVRDVAMHMVPRSLKSRFAPTTLLNELPAPFFHRVPNSSFLAHLDEMGYARIATLDFLDVVIRQNASSASPPAPSGRPQPHVPALGVEVSNGLLTLFTCWDSFQAFVTLCSHFAESIQEVQQVAEIDVQFDDGISHSLHAPSRSQPSSYHISEAASLSSETIGGFRAKSFSTVNHHQRAAYLLDEDEEEDMGAGGGVGGGEERKEEQAVERNILDEIDHNAFGQDMGVAQVYQSTPLELTLNENYSTERQRQTYLSMALQAAAERELERARREAEGAAEEASGRRANSLSPQRSHPNTFAAAASAPPPSIAQEQAAKWLTPRESDELVQREEHEKFISSLHDDEARLREEELAREREERRRRRREEERKSSRESKEQRAPPQVIDDHVPLADDDTRTGRARLKPPADHPPSVTEIQLLNLNVCWRMFGGQDWDMTRVLPQPSSSAPPVAATVSLSPEETPEVQLGSMGSVDIHEFYSTEEPYIGRHQPPNPFAASSRRGSRYPGDMTTVPLPADPYRSYAHTSRLLDSYTPTSRPPRPSVSPADIIPRGSRQTDRVMELLVQGFNMRFDQYGPRLQIASRLVLALDDIQVHDLITSSPFNHFLCYYHRPGDKGREMGSSMLRLEMTSVRPDPTREREEYRVKLSVLPLRLNVDQEAIEFFIQFFAHEPMEDSEGSTAEVQSEASSSAAPQLREGDQLSECQEAVMRALLELNELGGLPPPDVPLDADLAHDVCRYLIDQQLTTGKMLASAMGYSESQFTRWKLHHEYTATVGAAAASMINRILLISGLRNAAFLPGGDESEEDEGLATGIGADASHTLLRRIHSNHSLVPSTAPFPPMPSDWIPSEFARHHSNLVPALQEAYNKYYDTIYADLPPEQAAQAKAWRLTPGEMALHPSESANEYRTRLLSHARSAARSQLQLLHESGVREVEQQVYIQSFHVPSKIVLCIDWKPNRFDLRGLQNGDWSQLANLLPLENMELDLKAVHMTGLSGWGRVGVELAKLWAYDLAHHQAHRYLAGVQPIRSIVNVGSGVADLVVLPVSHFRQHGSLKRGVQRGLTSFLRNVSLESMSAAARLAQGAQSILEHVDDVLTYRPAPLPSHAHSQFTAQRARMAARGRASLDSASMPAESRRRSAISKRANPPSSAAEGFRQAYESLSRGLQSAASQMIVVPREEYARRGSSGAVKSALRAMPSALLTQPLIGGMEAIHKMLNGAVNSIDPQRKKETQDKFKSDTTSR